MAAFGIVSTPIGEVEVSSPVRKAWMRISMEDELFPKQQIPLSTSLKWTNEKAEANTYGYNATAGVARTLLSTSGSHLRHSQVQICV